MSIKRAEMCLCIDDNEIRTCFDASWGAPHPRFGQRVTNTTNTDKDDVNDQDEHATHAHHEKKKAKEVIPSQDGEEFLFGDFKSGQKHQKKKGQRGRRSENEDLHKKD